ncbi:GSCFA domain-containing protein [Lutimaribacter sp. EGI FJ00015]|uniref:GSCFA domain-containing protein n=1 Tax=Lutimaribacter degradans TaxID=2945989 RepID=A0ACC6A0Y9_9RHOB|nr:GSCFA domain-containing protein [Lutimaribacter sp. EGI FJ00013]MCM2563661.1 GSCFA domain-containing protein [Lutimaribacter sp. EGI FJ00013]MCO0614803.1 GSCFA domain-containing protein [Lutimaribacter sp. EGI FJ00015]MCO0637513.1 GSCFA domain-containing protein [Lutimaribacter sp. EGI FJ00014]
MSNPYETLGPEAYWRPAVAAAGPFGLTGLWSPKYRVRPQDRIVTAGSCFAQHIGRALSERGFQWYDAEPAPPFVQDDEAWRYNYGIFSFRTGNIYTPKMLLQWLRLAFDAGEVPDEIWEEDGRFYDPLRPVIEPGGFASEDELRAARAATLAAIRDAVQRAHIFVFTLGLTESWENSETGLQYALCPGTVKGARFDPERHVFRNGGFRSLYKELQAALRLMRQKNKNLRVLLTVSPVPLTATASGQHVLNATSYSKSTLRAVAGQITAEYRFIDYFPSYEIITHPVFRGMFYGPNMRSVEKAGVDTVMGHFFADQARVFGAPKMTKRKRKASKPVIQDDELKCEEELLGAFAK